MRCSNVQAPSNASKSKNGGAREHPCGAVPGERGLEQPGERAVPVRHMLYRAAGGGGEGGQDPAEDVKPEIGCDAVRVPRPTWAVSLLSI